MVTEKLPSLLTLVSFNASCGDSWLPILVFIETLSIELRERNPVRMSCEAGQKETTPNAAVDKTYCQGNTNDSQTAPRKWQENELL